MRGELIERLLDERVVDEHCRPCSQPTKPRGALRIAREQTMDVGTEHASARRNGPFGYSALELRKWTHPISTFGDAHVHFEPVEGNSVARCAACDRELLLSVEHGVDVK